MCVRVIEFASVSSIFLLDFRTAFDSEVFVNNFYFFNQGNVYIKYTMCLFSPLRYTCQTIIYFL